MADGRITEFEPVRRRFTADEYHRMAEAGILHEDDRLELIDGEILRMAAIGSRHFACVNGFTAWFATRLAGRAIVSVQNPVRLSTGSEPEPDIALLRPRADRYAAGLPGPDAVFLLVEVADTTLRYDRETKLPLYAEAGIPEVWIVDLHRERVLIYRGPRDGDYQHVTTVTRGGSLSPQAFPDVAVPVDEILP